MKLFFPLFNVCLAAAAFFMIADPLVNKPLAEATTEQIEESDGGIRALLVRKNQLEDAIEVAKELRQKAEALRIQFNSFDEAELAKLDKMLPNNADSVQLVIDVNNIAEKNGMTIKDIKVNDEESQSSGSRSSSNQASEEDGSETINEFVLSTASLSFTVSGTYEMYKDFMSDLSKSLRIMDISSSSFNSDDKGVYNYQVEVKTYWLK